MKRALAVSVVAVGLLGGSVAVAAPSQAAAVKTGAFPLCAVGDRDCGGYMWVQIPMSKIPEKERDSSLKVTLKDRKGKKVRGYALDGAELQTIFVSNTFPTGYDYSPWLDWTDIGGYSIVSHDTMRGDGPIFTLPTDLKAGKYTLSVKIKASGYWDCSVTYHDVCRWQKSYTWSKTAKVKLRAIAPTRWIPAG